MQRFDHPSIVNGQISFEDQTFDVVDGVVECPASIGRNADWPLSMKPAPVKADPPVDQAPVTAPVTQLVRPTDVPPAGVVEPDPPDAAAMVQTLNQAVFLDVLGGTVDQVAAFVAEVVDPEALLTINNLEAAGKHRKGVGEAIEARLQALGATD